MRASGSKLACEVLKQVQHDRVFSANCKLQTANCLLLHHLTIPFLVLRFGFVEQEFGEDTFIGHGQYVAPLGDITPGKGVYGVDVFKFFKGLDARPFLQSIRSRCQKPVLVVDKFG